MSATKHDILKNVLPTLIDLRHAIHRYPDLSGSEDATVQRLLDYLAPFKPDQVIRSLGGHGLGVVFEGKRPGPTTIFTSELDAVPIADQGEVSYRSQVPGAGHMCGHDGHMAVLAGLGGLVGQERPQKGRVVLLFRPQEETGRGAPAVVADKRMIDLEPDYVFGFHTIPGYQLGSLLYRYGLFAWAATDFVIELIGKSAHGGQPDAGRSPALALSKIIARIENLHGWTNLDPRGHAGQAAYARLGESDHGTTPGIARLRATLRSQSNEGLEMLCQKVEQEVAKIAGQHHLQWKATPENWIPATNNHQQAVDLVLACAKKAGLAMIELDQAQRWSDDFGVLTQTYVGAFFGMGGGDKCGQLHGPDFDFPDAILEPALRLYQTIVAQVHGP